ncbi:MAG: alpha/beta hydrolase [Nitrospirae bacterium]|nr:alpha/beta hydrolase [Nitrospirota bacterium]
MPSSSLLSEGAIAADIRIKGRGGIGRFRGKVLPFLLLITLLSLPGCSSVFFYPLRGLLDNPLAAQYHPIDLFFETSDGLTLHGWFFKGEEPQHGTILVLHGNAENISTHVNSVLWLIKEGFNIFIFDYRGYGKSEGTPTVKGVHLDAEAALNTLFTLPEVDDDSVAVLGQSIGGAIAIYTVANSPNKYRVKALVVDSAFSSYRRIAREKLAQFFITWPFQYPLSFTLSEDYSPVNWVKKISPIPLLLIHGDRDPIVPTHHSRILFNAALDPKELWISGIPGHTTSFADEQIRKNLVTFLLNNLHRQE